MSTYLSMTHSTSMVPKSPLSKLVLYHKPKPFKVMVLGQSGVGKSALVVRFITRRFIGEYDSKLQKIYGYQTVIDNEAVYFEVLDSASDPNENEYALLESNILWAEAFILMYSVIDKCSFDECTRLKFLINYKKNRRRLANSTKHNSIETPVVLVGNKIDQVGDRMVSTEDGQRCSKDIGCVCFQEISVRESIDQVWSIFRDVRRFWRVSSKWRGSCYGDGPTTALSRPLARAASDSTSDCSLTPMNLSSRSPQEGLDEEVADVYCEKSTSPRRQSNSEFRARASTDSHLPQRPSRPRYPLPSKTSTQFRRMSVAMRGNNENTY